MPDSNQDHINYFCGHCDLRDNRERCPGAVQARYVGRNWCGWSYRNKVHIGPVTNTTISFGGRDFNRAELDQLDEAIFASKSKQISQMNLFKRFPNQN